MFKSYKVLFIYIFILCTASATLNTKLESKLPLKVPGFEELAKTLQDGLLENFEIAQVTIVDCPDLTEKPFCLAAKGIGGSARLVDIGGPGFLYPSPQTDKIYNIRQICNTSDLPNAFVLGSGSGPLHSLGYNSEMIHNSKFIDEHRAKFQSYSIRLENSSSAIPYSVKLLGNESADEFALMANLLLTEGKTDKVVKVVAKKRTGKENFVTSMRLTLAKKYGTAPVGLGGTFFIRKGKANIHLMPELPERFSSIKELSDDWLKYFEMSSPLVCASVFISYDPGLDLRIEHTHCFSCDQKRGGHYHNDTTADEIEYEGYFTPAQLLYRIDKPLLNNFPL